VFKHITAPNLFSTFSNERQSDQPSTNTLTFDIFVRIPTTISVQIICLITAWLSVLRSTRRIVYRFEARDCLWTLSHRPTYHNNINMHTACGYRTLERTYAGGRGCVQTLTGGFLFSPSAGVRAHIHLCMYIIHLCIIFIITNRLRGRETALTGLRIYIYELSCNLRVTIWVRVLVVQYCAICRQIS